MPSGWSWSALTIPDLVKVIETSGGNPITLLIRRAGETFPLALTPRPGCGYSIELASSDAFNAVSDGTRIVVFTGLFNHVPDDREIAVIVAHELAHNILRHGEKKRGNAAVGGAAGLLVDIGLLALGINTQGAISQAAMEAGAKAYSQEFESEADYLGVYMLARAGFDIEAAPDFYRRMGAQNPSSQIKTYFSTHPSTPERAVATTQTILEIQDKTNRQEALLPKNLEGQSLAVRAPDPATAVIVTTAQRSAQGQAALALAPSGQAVPAPSIPIPSAPNRSGVVQPTSLSGLMGAAQPTATQPTITPTSRASIGTRALAQLFLIKGPIVTNPPQTFSAEFLETGKAQVILSGRRLLTGTFELFGLEESIKAKSGATLINHDSVKPVAGAETKAFAVLSDGSGTQLECAYSFSRSRGRGEGTCADNQRNTYKIIFD